MEIKQLLFLAVRIFGTALVTWLASTGKISEDAATNVIVGVAAALIAAIWSLFNKMRAAKKVEVALDLPAGSSKAKLKSEMKTK